MTELKTDPRVRPFTHETDDALPALQLFIVVQAGASESDSRFRRNADHLRHYERCSTQCTRAKMNEMEIVGNTVDCAVHVHRRHDYSIVQRHSAQLERSEHRRRRAIRIDTSTPNQRRPWWLWLDSLIGREE